MPVTILGDQLRKAGAVRGTVLFADLRGYTTLAERLNPTIVVDLLEEYFAVLARAVEAHGGTVFHLAGDSLMAGFGIGDATKEPVQGAVDASRRIVTMFAPVSARWERRFGLATGVGVGVHVGELAVTELGPVTHRRQTLIGDTVNVAARLCQRARAGEVLFTSSVAEGLAASVARVVIALPDFTLRGREAPLRIFCVPARERLNLDRQTAQPAVPAGLPTQSV